MPQVLLFFFAIIAMLVIVAMQANAAAKRAKVLAQWARARGFSFLNRPDESIEDHFPQFSVFSEGSDRYAYNLMIGRVDGRPTAWCFDYHYETYSRDSKGRRTTHHHHSSNIILDFGYPLKELTIRREGFFDKVTGFFGFDDIDFESAEFSRRFHVKAKDRKWAYDVISQKAMEALLDAPKFRLAMRGPHFLIRRASRITPAEYDAALKLGHLMLSGIPKDALSVRS